MTTTPTLDEVAELVTTLFASPPGRLTNCSGWTVHELVAHLAAGAAEQADLIEEQLAGNPSRPTRGFEEREAPFRAFPDAELRDRLVVEAARFAEARERLGAASVAFTGRRMSAAELEMHGRSECALHRWDVVGRDEIGWEILGHPELTRHALTVLTDMSSLAEAPAHRIAGRVPEGTRAVLRSPYEPDVVVTTAAGAVVTLTLVEPHDATAHVELDAAARLLLLWGRREPSARICLRADGPERALVDGLLGR